MQDIPLTGSLFAITKILNSAYLILSLTQGNETEKQKLNPNKKNDIPARRKRESRKCRLGLLPKPKPKMTKAIMTLVQCSKE